nr:AAA family ATPase [Saprospiraceae bacterium]
MSIKRQIVEQLLMYKEKFPILAITGPRQSGKTTMLKNLFPDYAYVNLENPDNRFFAEDDPNGFLETYSDKVILDEVQHVPFLFSYLQDLVDNSGKMGQFILSGSQNFHLMANITQSLAGRVAIFKLMPFDFQELEDAGLLNDDYAVNMIRGFYPAIYQRDILSRVYYDNYIQTYIERDVSTITKVKDLKAF